MMPVIRSTSRGPWPALPFLFLLLSPPASAEGEPSIGPDPTAAPARSPDDGAIPSPDGTEAGAATAPEKSRKRAGDRPPPVDPERATAPDEAEREPVSPTGKVSLAHDSVLDDYVPYEEVDGPSWIDANRRVGEIGGWREYAKELYAPAPDASADEEDAR